MNPNEATSAPFEARDISKDALAGIEAVADEVGGAYVPLPETEGAVGYTHFDSPASEDNQVSVLMTQVNMDLLPSQSLVRIKSLNEQGVIDRVYLGVVVAGPFAEPDGLRADSPLVVATTVKGRIFLPRYHGRARVEILGEEVNGQLAPPRFRPKPNSPVFPLSSQETTRVLRVSGNVRVGHVVGQEEIAVGIPTNNKAVLPRHMGIIGTTGGGKSTTVSGLVCQLQAAGVSAVLVDVEGEYTDIDRPTTDPKMLSALKSCGLEPRGVQNVTVYHLVGRQTSREGSTACTKSFCLQFADLSPYAVMDIMDLTEAQRTRFMLAYDATKLVLKDLKVFPADKSEEHKLLEIDEFESGYPRMTLSHLIDIASGFLDRLAGNPDTEFFNPAFKTEEARGKIKARMGARKTDSEISWRALLARLWQVHRLRVFDSPTALPLPYAELVKPGQVSVIDLSDTDSPYLNNLVIAGLLRGIQGAQEVAVEAARARTERPTPVSIIVEEAHEFLSRERIGQMPALFQQVAKIAKRGRKRWLGLVFVTQLPQHLPDEILGLLNNWVLHKISDSGVVDRLRKSISGIDKSQWGLVPGLAPGQALVSLTHMARPLLLAIDPTPCHLRLTE